MASNRTLAKIQPGEFIATVTWTERIGGQNIDRCREHAPLKIRDKDATLYLDDDAERTLTFHRKLNKSVKVYVGLAIEDMVRERVKNYVRNNTKCCWMRGDLGSCAVHTQSWFDAQVKREADRVREQMVPEPDRAAIESEASARRAEREAAKAAGEAEWCRLSGCGKAWLVRVADKTPGDAVTVRSRSGGTSKVKLIRKLRDDVWEHQAA